MTSSVTHKIRGAVQLSLLAAVVVGARAVYGGVAESQPTSSRQSVGLGSLPFYFEANPGQDAGGFQFFARGRAADFFVAPTEAVLSLTKFSGGRQPAPLTGNRSGITDSALREALAVRTAELRFEFSGANAAARVTGAGELSAKANYFLGNDRTEWRTGVPLFERVRVEQIYPGVDLVYYGNEHRLEYDFVVAPKADPAQISIHFAGADKVRVNTEGDLVFTLGEDEICQPKPIVYQDVNGTRKPIAGAYALNDSHTVSFKLGEYDRELPLVIDPVLSYSTYFGGNGEDAGRSVKVDNAGNVYVAGETMGGLPTSTNTTVFGSFHTSTVLHPDAFIAKFSNSGSNLVYLAYIGGRRNDVALDLAVDGEGSAYITGYTDSTNFPTVNAIQSGISGDIFPGLNTYLIDGFVAKLNPSGTALTFSTYLGGVGIDEGVGIALDASTNVYIVGYTESTNGLPVFTNSDSRLTNYHGNGDAFVAKLVPDGASLSNQLAYFIYLGGTNLDLGSGIAVDKNSGAVFVTGYTLSVSFPTNNPIQPRLGGGQSIFVTKLTNGVASAVGIDMSTYYGGFVHSGGYRITVDGDGNFYVTGSTAVDPNFPISPSAINRGGLFRTDDAAANWTLSSTGLKSVVIPAIAVDSNPLNMYAGTWHGVARSTDGGATWVGPAEVVQTNLFFSSAIEGGTVQALAIDPTTAGKVFAGTATDGVFVSTNSGVSWSPTVGNSNLPSQVVSALLVFQENSGLTNIFAGTSAGLSRSTNGGKFWRDSGASSGIGSSAVRALVVNPNLTPMAIYAGTANGVFYSTNSGNNWTAFNAGLSNLTVQALLIDPASPTTIYAGTAGGIFRSTNNAPFQFGNPSVWTRITANMNPSNVMALAIDSTSIYAGTTRGLFKRDKAGTNWVSQTNGLSSSAILSLAANNPLNPTTIFAGTTATVSYGGLDAFVWKGPNGYTAVLGGLGDEEGWDIAVDGAGQAHVVGWTGSTNFPITNVFGLLRATNSGNADAFVSELSADGGSLLHSTYLGGAKADFGYGIAVDNVGSTYVVGTTASQNFPRYGAFQSTFGGTNDAFLVKLLPESRPVLTVEPTTKTNFLMVFSWPAYWTDFVLQGTAELKPTNSWQTLSGQIITNGVFSIGVPKGFANQFFFRLARP